MKNKVSSFLNYFVEFEKEEDSTKTNQDYLTMPSNVGPTTPVSSAVISTDNSLVAEIGSKYEDILKRLNKDGIDFFEYFTGVAKMGGGPNDYKAMFIAIQTMDPDMSIQQLTSDAEFYIEEIQKESSNITAAGKRKLETLDHEKNSKRKSLTTDVYKLQKELTKIQNELTQKENELSNLDQVYGGKITKTQAKLEANKRAVDIICSKINVVKGKLLSV